MIARLGSATVLGAGTMGAQIACLLAGVGTRVTLLDLDPPTAAQGLERALRLRPSPVYRASDASAIRTGGFEGLVAAVTDADWIVEAIVEQLEPKRELHARVDAALAGRAADAWPIVSTNTSGIRIASIAAGRSAPFQRAFLGTHFFNPPRYGHLLELIPTADTDPQVVGRLEDLASRLLGKGTVRAKDTPAFIANRLGVYGLQRAIELALELGLGPDEVDELTGPLIGRPKSATFRTLDLVGLDVAVAVAEHCYADLPEDPEREAFRVAPVLGALLEKGALGEKAGAGFFRREGKEILALDLVSGEYRPRRRVASPTVDLARGEPDLGRRLGLLIAGRDAAATYLRRLFDASLGYAATVGPDIAAGVADVDAAMRWGFGWQLGPFQTWDVLGLAPVAGRLAAVPPLVERVLAGPGGFYRDGSALSFPEAELRPIPARPGSLDLGVLRLASASAGLASNTSASLVELGGGILGLELHGKLNILGPEAVDSVRRACDLASRAYDGLVIGTRAADFSAGANLALMLLAAEEGEWDELEREVRRFQGASQAIRHAAVPVVAAPRGLTLGGGAEFCLAAARRQPLAETYIGLVEVGVGLIPAGGGSTGMARWAAEQVPDGSHADHFAFFQQALELIASARVATSAEEARAWGLLRPIDLVTADPDRQWADAAATARHLAEIGYRPLTAAPILVEGRRGIAAAEALTYNELLARRLSEHDRTVVLELARVMSGGDVAEGTPVAEEYLLGLEREALLRLLGLAKTRERIRHTLKTGKPLRN
ncbi:MAG: 3-hydroxyacyl-CoA dehydrogenase/enoyl-CoA hydratase family protein [Chloroflexota bacterium]|nr:MAG: 3-hydroxyacyl-CoA dehydrogenase/enoyl-CoA hydratase family protein [Chloroflexota bacterium]